jgi:hypothetical protein
VSGTDTRRRGQPLAMLALLLAGWTGARLTLWESPFPSLPAAAWTGLPPIARLVAPPPAPDAPAASSGAKAAQSAEPARPREPAVASPVLREPLWGTSIAPSWELESRARGGRDAAADDGALASPGLAGGHQIMFMAALAQIPLPAALAAAARQLASQDAAVMAGHAPAVGGTPPARSRWSGDGWLLWRQGGSFALAPGQASYGGSQAGAVLRYALAPSSPRAPQAYARVSRALTFAESEAAVGLAARPLPGVPVRLLAEGRVQRSGGVTRVRPAAAIVSELPSQRLPLGAQAELYAQAGYVGGANATPFFDAQLTAERPMAQLGPGELRVGGGIWAGGQKDATRLDLGPRASLKLGLGDSAAARLAVDWRVRVAGDAEPGSGPALTLSAGF